MKELKRLNNFLLKYKGRLILGLIITVVSRVFSLVTPRLVGDSMTSIENYLNIESGTPDELKEVLFTNIVFIIERVAWWLHIIGILCFLSIFRSVHFNRGLH